MLITITITITSYIQTAYYYYYYVLYLNSLLLLLLCDIFKQPITITITRKIKKAYYYYFPDYYYYYYFPISIAFIITVEPKKHKQADYKVIFKDLYYFHCITHYHRHITTDNSIIKLSWLFMG